MTIDETDPGFEEENPLLAELRSIRELQAQTLAKMSVPVSDFRLDICNAALAGNIQPVPIQSHLKNIKIKTIVASLSVADAVDVKLGEQTWRFYDLGVGINSIPFPEVLQAGVDVSIKPVTGTTLLTAYLIVETEKPEKK